MTYVRMLYGSRARGDQDGLSDTDHLVIDDEPGADYSWDDILRLRSYGSLFLWHLALEGVVLDSDEDGADRWTRLSTSLPAYRRVDDDIESFQTVLTDVQHALTARDTDVLFEASVLARTVRHAAILGCHVTGDPNFSRYGAVEKALIRLQIQRPAGATFESLYDAVLRPEDFALDASAVDSWVTVGFELTDRIRQEGVAA